MNIRILVGALIGIGLSNLAQWAKWIKNHRGKPLLGYWMDAGVGHLMGNLLLDAAFLILYDQGWLDEGLYRAGKLLGQTERLYDGNIPVTPQLAVLIMGGADYFGDLIMFMFGKILGRLFPGFFSPSSPPQPAPQEGK